MWLLVAAMLVAAAVLIFRYRDADASPKTDASGSQKGGRGAAIPAGGLQISTATAKKGDIGVYVNALGTVTPIYTVIVTSRVTGQIMSVNYREGQMVHKGDLLLDIDPRPYQAALAQVQGQLGHDQAVLNEARIDYERYKTAYTRNAIPKQQMEDQEQVVHQDEGTVQNDQGQLQNAQVNLVYCHITSPIDGRVGLRLVDPGNIVQGGSTTALVVVTQLQPITVIFSVAEDYLPQIQQQLNRGSRMPVDAFDHSQKKKLASGSLQTLDNQIDPTTGTIKIRALFANQDSALFANQFVNARLQIDTEHGVTLVPPVAIQLNGQGAFVYVLQPDQTVAIRAVTVGTTDGNQTAVQGVNPGDVVATNNFDKLQDGVKVAVQNGANGTSQGNSP